MPHCLQKLSWTEVPKISDIFNIMNIALKRYEEIANETKDQTSEEEYVTWTVHLNHVLLLFSIISEPYSSEKTSPFKKENSLLSFRISELINHLSWTWFSVRAGAYHQVIRELRYAFESILMAYYLDMGHPDASITSKLEIIKEIENPRYRLYGIRLIDELKLKEKQCLKELYAELSKYVHCSYEELKPFIVQGTIKKPPSLGFHFNRVLFTKCRDLTNETLDAVYFLLLNGLPDVRNQLKMSDYGFKDYLEKFEFNLALTQLK